jgi:hypothetical protein
VRCAYFMNHKGLPADHTALTLSLNQRVAAQTPQGDVVGYIPTEYNYIAGCLKGGWRFPAAVVNTSMKPFPRIWVQVTPER